MNYLNKWNNLFSHKKDEEGKKKVMKRLEDFIHLFEQEITSAASTPLIVDAKSDEVTFILTTLIEILQDGFTQPKGISDDNSNGQTASFFKLYLKELEFDMLSFVKKQSQFQTDTERACGWLVLELNHKSLHSSLRTAFENKNVIRCYEGSASINILRDQLLNIITELDSLDYIIEGQIVQSYREHIQKRSSNNSGRKTKSYLAREFPDLKSDESDGEPELPTNTNGVPLNMPNNGESRPVDMSASQPVNSSSSELEDIKKNMMRLRGMLAGNGNTDMSKSAVVGNPSTYVEPEKQAESQEKTDFDLFRQKALEKSRIQLSTTPYSKEDNKEAAKQSNAPKVSDRKSSHQKVSITKFMKANFDPKNVYAKGLARQQQHRMMDEQGRHKSTEEGTSFYHHHLDRKYKNKKLKHSERLYLEKFKPEEGMYEYKPEPSTIRSPATQDYKCYSCAAPLSKVMLFFNKDYGYCNYTGHYYCYDCTSKEKSIIPWRVIRDFSFKRYTICKEASEEIEKLSTKANIVINPENPITQKHKIVYDTLVRKRELHLIYDMICETFFVLDIIPKRSNLVLKQNLFSLKNLQEMYSGALLQIIVHCNELLKKHIHNCSICSRKGRTCKICSNAQKMDVFDIQNTSFCKKCNRLYHARCLLLKGCIACSHDN